MKKTRPYDSGGARKIALRVCYGIANDLSEMLSRPGGHKCFARIFHFARRNFTRGSSLCPHSFSLSLSRSRKAAVAPRKNFRLRDEIICARATVVIIFQRRIKILRCRDRKPGKRRTVRREMFRETRVPFQVSLLSLLYLFLSRSFLFTIFPFSSFSLFRRTRYIDQGW